MYIIYIKIQYGNIHLNKIIFHCKLTQIIAKKQHALNEEGVESLNQYIILLH